MSKKMSSLKYKRDEEQPKRRVGRPTSSRTKKKEDFFVEYLCEAFRDDIRKYINQKKLSAWQDSFETMGGWETQKELKSVFWQYGVCFGLSAAGQDLLPQFIRQHHLGFNLTAFSRKLAKFVQSIREAQVLGRLSGSDPTAIPSLLEAVQGVEELLKFRVPLQNVKDARRGRRKLSIAKFMLAVKEVEGMPTLKSIAGMLKLPEGEVLEACQRAIRAKRRVTLAGNVIVLG